MNKTTLAQQAKAASFLPPARGILQRKCACGNYTVAGGECAACAQKKSDLQRKLTIGASNGPLEQEADRVAEQVMAAPIRSAASGASPRIQRYGRQTIDRVDSAPASVDHALASSSKSLDLSLQQEMGQRFGYDFSRVRVYSGAEAEQSARDVSANAYTVGHHIVFGAGQFRPGTQEGRSLIAHELTHVVQQSGAEGISAGQGKGKASLTTLSPMSHPGLQRQTAAGNQAQPTPDMLRIYSFGPTGAGRVAMHAGTTVFPPAARVDDKGNELVRSGTTAQPILSRFGRYFTLDERHRPYPPPVPTCTVRAITEWKPDDGSAPSKDQKEDNEATHYAPGEPLSTKLGSEYIFPNDRPGVLTLGYVFINPDLPFLLLAHSVHFVNDPTAPPGATVLTNEVKDKGSASAALPEAKAATDAPTKSANGAPVQKPEAKGTALPPSPPAQNTPPAVVGEIKELTELYKKTADAVTKDIVVKKLRDLFSNLQPFIPAKDAKQMIDDAIASLIKDGGDAAIMALLKGITGKSPTTMPENRNQTGPDVPQKDLGENIFQGPKITIPDTPKLAEKHSFQYQGGPRKSYEAGALIRFTLVPPNNFHSLQGAKRLVIVAENERNTPSPERFARVDLTSPSAKLIEMQAPQKPGKYVIRVDIGLGFDYSNMQEFEVTAPQKK